MTKASAPNSCASALSGLRFFFNHVAEQQICIEYSLKRKVQKLPTVLPQEDIDNIINAADNLKHRLILMTTYSAGLRSCEVRMLKPEHIESKKMLIKVEKGKGGKQRYTLLAKRLLPKSPLPQMSEHAARTVAGEKKTGDFTRQLLSCRLYPAT